MEALLFRQNIYPSESLLAVFDELCRYEQDVGLVAVGITYLFAC